MQQIFFSFNRTNIEIIVILQILSIGDSQFIATVDFFINKGLKINEDKTKVMCVSFGTGTTWVVGNVKYPCSVCLKGVGVNSIRCTQCIQWVHARCSRVKDSLKNVESSSSAGDVKESCVRLGR